MSSRRSSSSSRMKNTSRSIKSNRSNNKVIGRKLSHKQLCERIEQLESTIKQERVAAVEIELEARRLHALKTTNAMHAIRRKEIGDVQDSLKRQMYKKKPDPGYVTAYIVNKTYKKNGPAVDDDQDSDTRSITSDLSILETPRYPRKSSDITRYIDQVGKSTYKGTRHESFDNRRRRSDVTLAAENYLCATNSPITMPMGLKYGIKYDNLIQEGETLYKNQTYQRIDKMKGGKLVKNARQNELENGWRWNVCVLEWIILHPEPITTKKKLEKNFKMSVLCY